MNKRDLVVAFGVVMIASFIVGTFSVLMYKPQQQATPTPQANREFAGAGTGSATVKSLGKQFYVDCNTTTDVAPIIKAALNASLVYRSTDTGYIAIAGDNATQSLDALRAALSAHCNPAFLRSAKLDFKEKVTLHSTQGGNESRDLHPVTLNQATGFVNAAAQAGDGVNVVVYAEILDDQVVRVVIEETLRQAEPSPSPQEDADGTQGNATINESRVNGTNNT